MRIQIETRSILLTPAKRKGETESRSRKTAGLRLPNSSGMMEEVGRTNALITAANWRKIVGMQAYAVIEKKAANPPSRPSMVNKPKYNPVTSAIITTGLSTIEAAVKTLMIGELIRARIRS